MKCKLKKWIDHLYFLLNYIEVGKLMLVFFWLLYWHFGKIIVISNFILFIVITLLLFFLKKEKVGKNWILVRQWHFQKSQKIWSLMKISMYKCRNLSFQRDVIDDFKIWTFIIFFILIVYRKHHLNLHSYYYPLRFIYKIT